MRPGIRVIRGPDWRLGDQDGGAGYLGTVINIFPNNSVLVRWDIGTETTCRAGLDGAFDLRLYDNAQIGTKFRCFCDAEYTHESHVNVTGLRWKCLHCKDTDFCTQCYMGDKNGIAGNQWVGQLSWICDGSCLDTNDNNIYGFRWKCLECSDRDNCTPCYMMTIDEVCMRHTFVRYVTPFATVVRVPPRKKSKRIPLYGIFPGAEVTKIASGGSQQDEKIGIVKELITLQPDAYRSAVKVEWLGSPPKKTEEGEPDYPIYRVGADGKVELKLVTAASAGTVYIDHLPVLDLTMPVDVEFNEGDRVRVDVNVDTYKPLLKEYGGWTDDLEKVLGEEGIVLRIADPNKRLLTVKYDSVGIVNAMYMNVLTKISTISAGDIVKIIQDQNKVKKLQIGHGGWREGFLSILGATGRVVRIDDSKDAIVDVKGETFVLNQSCLVLQQRNPLSEQEAMKRSLKGSFRRQATLTVPAAARRTVKPDVSIDVGARVVRGPNWSPDFEDQDGGEGCLGSIVELCGLKDSDMYPKQCVVVQWDNGEKNVYRAGYEAAYDLRVYDNAGIGVKHAIPCTECKINPIFGMLWTCDKCPDVNLCSECYNADAHDIQHPFVRYDTVDRANGVKVPKRQISKAIPALGIFERCKVRRGPDWRWHNQDGGEDKYGDVIAIVNFSPDTDRDAAEVTWENGYTNVYRLGYKGRLDVACVKPVQCGKYYRDHLPILKLELEAASSKREPEMKKVPEEVPKPEDVDKEAARFQQGDKVRIEIDVDVLKMIEENRKAWNDHMTECIGRTGTVLVSRGNDITVDFETAGKWTFHESVLNKVREFVTGEVVQVEDSADHVKMLQTERGGWNELMVKVIGKKGRVEEIDEDGDVQVSFGDYTWTFNPECLTPVQGPADYVKYSDEAPKPPVVTERRPEPKTEEEKMEELFEMIITGDTERVNRIIQREPQMMLMDLQGKYAVHLACKHGQMDIMKAMIKCASKEALLEIKDSENITPLLAAVGEGQIDMVRFLVAEGADTSVVNLDNEGAVHIAVNKQNLPLLKVLRELNFDVNQKDKVKQSPIFDAIAKGGEEIADIILNWPGLDIHYQDSIGFSPFFSACRKGHLKAVQKILQLRPMEIKTAKESDGFTGLHFAAYNGNKEVVQYLVNQPLVEIDARNQDQHTPLHLACADGFLDVVKILVNKGADASLCDGSKKNCLHLYMTGKSVIKAGIDTFREMVEYLVGVGVSVTDFDSDRKRPGDYVAENMSTEYRTIVENRLGKDALSPQRKVPEDDGQKPRASSFTESRGDKQAPARMAQSTISRSKNAQPAEPRKIEDIRDLASGQGEDIIQAQSKRRDKGDEVEEEARADPELCESCEEEPLRFKIEPCGHLLCADCIPKRKMKKKICAVCGQPAEEVVEHGH